MTVAASLSLAATVALPGPAQAGAIKDLVCNDLASQVAHANTGMILASAAATNAGANTANQLAVLQAVKGSLVTAAINLVNAVDASQNQAFFQALYNQAVAGYSNQAVAYVTARAAQAGADSDLTFKQQAFEVLSGMRAGLGCVGVPT